MGFERGKWPSWLVMTASILVVWAVLVALVIIEVEPPRGMSVRAWVLLIVLGPPVYVGVEWAGHRLFHRKNDP